MDGRNRYRACTELEIDVWAKTWDGNMDPVEYVMSQNLYRRHLTQAQRSLVAAKALEYHLAGVVSENGKNRTLSRLQRS